MGLHTSVCICNYAATYSGFCIREELASDEHAADSSEFCGLLL